MKKYLVILLFLMAVSASAQISRFIFWKQVNGKLYNYADSCKITDMRKVGSFYRIQAYGYNFYVKGDSTGGSGSVYWTDILDKPSVFVPDVHNQGWSTIQDAPATYAPSAHTQSWTTITDQPATYAPSTHSQSWTTITDQPATYAPSAHEQAQSTITGLPDSLSKKPDTTAARVHKIVAGTNVTISPTNGQGDVTINAAAGGSGSALDATDRYTPSWWIQPNAGLTTIVNVGFATAPTARGTASALRDSSGYYLNYASAAVIDSAGGWHNAVYTMTSAQEKPILAAQIKTGAAADTQACRIWVCLTSGYMKAAADTALHIAGFRFVPGTAGGWSLYTNDGSGTGTATATNVLIGIQARYKFKVAVYSGQTTVDSVVGWINGVRVAVNTTNLPGFTNTMSYSVRIATKAASAKNISIKKVSGEQG